MTIIGDAACEVKVGPLSLEPVTESVNLTVYPVILAEEQGNTLHSPEMAVSEQPSSGGTREDGEIRGISYLRSPHGSAPEASSHSSVPRWIPDSDSPCCMSCGLEFDWVRRRHHCRSCGRLFCDRCAVWRSMLPPEFGSRNPQRVCDPCHKKYEPMQMSLVSTQANSTRDNEVPEMGYRPFHNLPVSMTMGAEIRKATCTLKNFCQPGVIKDRSIPIELLSRARGLAFITTVKAGFVFAGHFGTGLVIARLDSGGWSSPSAIGTIGMSWGALIGGEVTDFMLILNTQQAVDSFKSDKQVSLGAEMSLAIGPLGRTGAGNLTAHSKGLAPIYSYSHSRGLFAGISLEGAVLTARQDVNLKFYGYEVRVEDLLSGSIQPPNAARPLYHALYLALSHKETQLRTNLSAPQISSTTPDSTTDIPDILLSHESL